MLKDNVKRLICSLLYSRVDTLAAEQTGRNHFKKVNGETGEVVFFLFPQVLDFLYSHWVRQSQVNGNYSEEYTVWMVNERKKKKSCGGSQLSFRPAKKKRELYNNNQRDNRRKPPTSYQYPRFLFPSDVMSLVQQENNWCNWLYYFFNG